MADTYGRGPNGEMTYGPENYDQWGVYMGNRAPMIAGADTNTGDFNQWNSTLPFEEWAKQYAKVQLRRNSGPLAQVTAAQGTPEYRDQVAAAERDARLISGWGGTVGNMTGLRPAKGAGLNMWNQYSGNKAGEIAPWAMNQARALYDRAARDRAAGIIHGPGGVSGGAPAAGSGTGFTGGTATGGAGSFTPGTGGVAPTNTFANPTGSPMAPPAAPRPMQPLLGSNPSGAPGGPTPQDSYMQTPRGGSKRGLRGLIG